MSSLARPRVVVGGPWFEELGHGQVFDDAPGLTLTEGHAALHQALAGDRLRLALDTALCREVTGESRPLVHPNLVCDVSIGQSTGASQRVRGNLFYRGLVLKRPVFIGETLRTRTEIVALKQNRRRAGGPATGLVAANIPQELDAEQLRGAVPAGWRLDRLRAAVPGPYFDELAPGQTFLVEAGETVTGAPELARLTLNVATAHTDASSSVHGRRLVYGGHTISIAAAHATRAIPAIATIVAWHGCDHLGPVFEGDVLRTELTVESSAADGLVGLRARVNADRADVKPEPVLDWSFEAVVA